MGIISWAEKCMSLAEAMERQFVEALVDHDAAVARADLPGLHAACLSALRQRPNQAEAGQLAGTSSQFLSVKRLEERVEQLKQQLATKQESERALQTAAQSLRKENCALQQVLHSANTFLTPPDTTFTHKMFASLHVRDQIFLPDLCVNQTSECGS